MNNLQVTNLINSIFKNTHEHKNITHKTLKFLDEVLLQKKNKEINLKGREVLTEMLQICNRSLKHTNNQSVEIVEGETRYFIISSQKKLTE